MRQILKFIFLCPALLAILSCSKEKSDFKTVVVNADLTEASTKMELTGLDSPFTSQRIWNWQEGDKAYACYRLSGFDSRIESSDIAISQENQGLARFTFTLPKSAEIKSIEYGSSAAFGQIIPGSSKSIPSTMIYASGDVESGQGGSGFSAVVLSHHCSYLYLDPDNINSKAISCYTLTGQGLKGGSDSETITVSFADYQTDGAWVAVSNRASDVSVYITLDGGSTVTAEALSSTGNGICRLINVKYKKFVDYE